MAANILVQDFCGANGLVYYGQTLLFVDDWNVNIVSDTIDITNISVYDITDTQNIAPLPPQVDADGIAGDPDLPFPKNLPDPLKPYKLKANFPPTDNQYYRKLSQYMTGRLNLDSGLRVANITCSGLCAAYNFDDEENYMPRVGNYTRMQFSNSIDSAVTIFNFPIVFVQKVSFDFNIKNYMRWTLTGISTGDFDMFPGTTD
jgi:hypothetical protein